MSWKWTIKKEIEELKSSPSSSLNLLKNENLNKEIYDLKKIIKKFTEAKWNFEYTLGQQRSIFTRKDLVITWIQITNILKIILLNHPIISIPLEKRTLQSCLLSDKSNSTKTVGSSRTLKQKRRIQKWVPKVVSRIINFTITIIGSSKVFQVVESSNSIPSVKC